jgi:antiviral helicase SKI2
LEDATYEVVAITMSSVALVTNRTVKVGDDLFVPCARSHQPFTPPSRQVDLAAILDRRLISALKATCFQLEELGAEWKARSYPPEVEWARMRSLEFQDALRIQAALLKKLDTFDCVRSADFEEKVGL